MTEKELQKVIDLAVERTINELKKKGMLKGTDNVIYEDAIELLVNYYRSGKTEANVTYAIQSIRFDPYFRIIPMYFEQKRTLESIAGELDVDISTVVRNKKRLCLEIYNEII